MIELHIDNRGRLIDPATGKAMAAENRPELPAGVVFDVDFVLHKMTEAPAGEYTLSGDIGFAATCREPGKLMMQALSDAVDGNRISFRGVSTDTLGFWTKPRRKKETLYLRMVRSAPGGNVSVLEDEIYCRPGEIGRASCRERV